MAEDTRKVLMVILSVSFVAIAFVGIALLFAWPGKSAARTPAGFPGNSQAVSAADAWVNPGLAAANPSPTDTSAPATAMQNQPSNSGTAISGDSIVIIYGSKPEAGTLVPQGGQTGTATAGSNQAGTNSASLDAQPSKPYTAAPATPAASTSSGTARTPSASAPTSAASTTSRTTATNVAAASPTIRQEYWIQAASLSSRSRAEDLQARLKANTLSAIISIHEIDGTAWYRVRIGPYPNKAEADGWLSRIRGMAGCEEAYVSMVSIRP